MPNKKAPKSDKNSRQKRKNDAQPHSNQAYRVGAISKSRQAGYLPFGREYTARLPYFEDMFIAADSTTSLSALGYTYRGNSVYDPRSDVGGHQPMQYDILSAVYERCWVHGCEVQLTFTNPSADGMWVGYRVRASTNAVGSSGKSLSYIQEMRDSECKPINNTGSQTATFRFFVPNAQVMGVRAMQYGDNQYSETTAGVLAAVSTFIEPYALSTSSSGVSDTVRYNIRLNYHAQFTNPVSMAQN